MTVHICRIYPLYRVSNTNRILYDNSDILADCPDASSEQGRRSYAYGLEHQLCETHASQEDIQNQRALARVAILERELERQYAQRDEDQMLIKHLETERQTLFDIVERLSKSLERITKKQGMRFQPRFF